MTNEEAIKLLSQIKDALLASNSWLPSTDNPIKESFDMAINALTAQSDIPTVDTPTVVPTCEDTISRQAAIDAILAVTGNSSVRELYEHVQEHGLSEMWSGGVNAAIDIIIAVPPIHPEPCEDTISRKAAIDALRTCYDTETITYTNGNEYIDYDQALEEIEQLPSAQPEIIRCKDCRHNQDCDIQYDAQAGEEFYCGAAERRLDA